jgi:hypothetical protein
MGGTPALGQIPAWLPKVVVGAFQTSDPTPAQEGLEEVKQAFQPTRQAQQPLARAALAGTALRRLPKPLEVVVELEVRD